MFQQNDFLEEMLGLIEKELKDCFGKNWDKKDAEYFLGKQKYSLDLTAINKNLKDPIEDFILRGGKRIRPMLFLLTLQLFGVNYKKYIDLALLIEVVHNGTLVLDDIEDDGDLRRGQPTCHRKFGLDTATNTGMCMHVLPLQWLIKSSNNLSINQQNRIWKIYTEELINVSFGQGLDIYWHKNHPEDVKEQKYLEMVRLKTGSLMRMSIRMACAIANRDEIIERDFQEFAENLGIAFQIIDDSLDLDRQDDMFGKSYGNDITEGKLSLPVIYTLRDSSFEDKKQLINILKKHTKNKIYITQALKIIYKSKALEKSRFFARTLLNDSWVTLENKYCKSFNMKYLKEVSDFVIKRSY